MVFNIIIFYCLVSAAINTILMSWSKGKISIDINLPKGKKYKNKVNPIYCLENNYFEPNMLYIHKYELKYVENEFLFIIFIFLIPYPILFYNFKYSNVGNVYFCSKKDINNWKHVNIGDYYEKKKEVINKSEQKIKMVDLQIENQINNFNKTFNENYR